MKLLAWSILLAIPLSAKIVPITVEHARTPEQLTWGLMQRSELSANHGMLFHYPTDQFISLWMFNCLKDLSAAFINRKGVILEIHELKAYPQEMDPARPVRSVKDFSKYSIYDPVYQFFITRSISSSIPISNVLEMDALWFKQNNIKPGDQVVWDQTPQAFIHTKENL